MEMPSSRTPFLVLIGLEPAMGNALATLLRTRLGWRVESRGVRDLSALTERPDVLLVHSRSADVMRQLRVRFPGTALVGHAPASREELWEPDATDQVLDQLAPLDVMVRCLRDVQARCSTR